jgi:UDP-N-acetylmuramate--alanine ligase
MTSVIPSLVLPQPPAPVHFVGIGGIGMSGLARILLSRGYQVTGSDVNGSDLTAALQDEGIPVTIGHTDQAHAASAALVVTTAAVQPGNLEVDSALAAGVRVIKRAELLGLLANAKTCLAVAGSHGKSTTSGMLVSALESLRAHPSYAVGAVVATTGTNAAPGDGPVMVVEADEYDYSFLTLTPDIAIVTNIDYDHPDLFPDQDSYDKAFVEFAEKVRTGGRLIVAGDDPGVIRILDALGAVAGITIDTFGESSRVDWRLIRSGDGWALSRSSRERIELRLPVPGRHNARNAAAALIALVALGYHANVASAALSAYEGVGRRFDLKGETNGIVVVDDYAHHPTEIRAVIQAARERYPGRRLIAAFQPHTYSRTRALMADFARSFEGASVAVILDIYPSRETDSLGVSAADLIAQMPAGAIAGGSPTEASERLAELAAPGDVILTLGAGDVTGVGPRLLELLAAKSSPGNG